MQSQLISSSYQARPWRTQRGSAWWLLCQPSPNVNTATHQLFVESSRVKNRRVPQRCVAELTSQVKCNPIVTRRKTPMNIIDQPPIANKARPLRINGTK